MDVRRSLWITLVGVHVRYKSPPVDGVCRASVVTVCGTFGYTWELERKSTPVESNGMSEMSLVDRQLRNVWANGIRNNLPRSNGRYIGRDALGIRRGKLPRSTICEMLARNRLLEYANCGSMALDVLAGRFRYYSWTGHARCAACVCHIGLLFGKCFWIGKVQQHHRIGSETNLQVGVLRYCSFVGYRNRFCI